MKGYPVARKRSGAIDFLGLQLHPVSESEVYAFIENVVGRGERALVVYLNIHGVNLGLRHPWFEDLINQAQLVFCDGDGVRWGARLLALPVPTKITYDRWIWRLAEFCGNQNYQLFFLGGRPGAAAQAAERLKAKYPGLKIAGVCDGYFDKSGAENERVISEINRLKPDILIVGFGMPMQEKWLSENWQRVDAHVFLTGGAVFDYASGRAKRAPQWMIKCHLEWFFRFLQEPTRLFLRYALGIPYFFLRVLMERVKPQRKASVQ